MTPILAIYCIASVALAIGAHTVARSGCSPDFGHVRAVDVWAGPIIVSAVAITVASVEGLVGVLVELYGLILAGLLLAVVWNGSQAIRSFARRATAAGLVELGGAVLAGCGYIPLWACFPRA